MVAVLFSLGETPVDPAAQVHTIAQNYNIAKNKTKLAVTCLERCQKCSISNFLVEPIWIATPQRPLF